MTDDVEDAIRVGLDPHNYSPTRLEKSRKALCAADPEDLKRDLLQAIGRELFDRGKEPQ
ncbi:MAG: hypothetical protein OXC65_15000 [Thiotrichales bacterium]|nr:hypothetical protein [Thiotrichales bacterium]